LSQGLAILTDEDTNAAIIKAPADMIMLPSEVVTPCIE